jgi:hypothetical protein
MTGSWIWEIVRVRNFDRSNPPLVPMDWSDDGFVAIFFAFMLNWVSNSLWQIIIYYFLGAMTNSPPKAADYAVSQLPPLLQNCFPDKRLLRVYTEVS